MAVESYEYKGVRYHPGDYITTNDKPTPIDGISDSDNGGAGFKPNTVFKLHRITITNNRKGLECAIFWPSPNSRGIYHTNFRKARQSEIALYNKNGKPVEVTNLSMYDEIDNEPIEMVIPKKPKIRY